MLSGSDPIECLQSALLQRRGKNRAYSLRAFARDLGISHCYLSQILNRRMKLSLKQAIRFSQLLGLGEPEARAFVAAAARDGYGQLRDGGRKAPRPGFFSLEMDRFNTLREWHHFAILDLTLLRSFRSDATWVARRLGIRASEVKVAVKRLQRLGLLEIRGGRWVKTHTRLAVPTKDPQRALRELHKQMLRKAMEELETGGDEAFEQRDITGSMIPVNPARLPEAKRRIARFRRSLLGFLSDGGPCEDLYQLNVQLFSLTSRRRRKRKAVA